ncbi:MAG: UDP-N-acetylmuramate dehydrogenase [Calditrichaeota bacterium]|nr:UDP-N-acetylmuramate dehydrogenase [Calditrichota bacterium]
MRLIDIEELSDAAFVRSLAGRISAETGGRIIIDAPLGLRTSLQIGGAAKLLVYPPTVEALGRLVHFCWETGLTLFIIGYGTNLLVSDAGFDGCIVDISQCSQGLKVKKNILTAEGGAWLGDAVQTAANKGLRGLEKLAGIPGGVGGALSMNAGAFGMFISDKLVEVQVVEPDGALKTLTKSDIGFGYRTAPGLAAKIVVSAKFKLSPFSRAEVQREIDETIKERYRRNAMILPSCGSVFKNPPGQYAAKLIEAVGGKGLRQGGVEVSPLHANFIVNIAAGSAGDVVKLIQRLRQRVLEQFGVQLELEVRTLGMNI